MRYYDVKGFSASGEKINDAMYNLYMTGINHDGHSWVTYSEVEETVGEILQAIVNLEIPEILMKFFPEEPCNYNSMDDKSDCDYCTENCDNHNTRDCWANAIKERWYDGAE